MGYMGAWPLLLVLKQNWKNIAWWLSQGFWSQKPPWPIYPSRAPSQSCCRDDHCAAAGVARSSPTGCGWPRQERSAVAVTGGGRTLRLFSFGTKGLVDVGALDGNLRSAPSNKHMKHWTLPKEEFRAIQITKSRVVAPYCLLRRFWCQLPFSIHPNFFLIGSSSPATSSSTINKINKYMVYSHSIFFWYSQWCFFPGFAVSIPGAMCKEISSAHLLRMFCCTALRVFSSSMTQSWIHGQPTSGVARVGSWCHDLTIYIIIYIICNTNYTTSQCCRLGIGKKRFWNMPNCTKSHQKTLVWKSERWLSGLWLLRQCIFWKFLDSHVLWQAKGVHSMRSSEVKRSMQQSCNSFSK